MLAKRIACTVLRGEHSIMRQTLSTTTAVLRAGQWCKKEPALRRLRELIVFEQSFDQRCHRPKCDALLEALHGRSAAIHAAMPVLMDGRKSMARLHGAALDDLAKVGAGETVDETNLPTVLDRLQALQLAQLQWEDTVLLPEAEGTLSAFQWSQMASTFSQAAYPAGVAYEPDGPASVVRRNPESSARFESSGFMLDPGLDLTRVPLFHPPHRSLQ